MIIIFILIGLTILGITMWQIWKHTNHKIFGSDVFGFAGVIIGIIAGIVTAVLIPCAIVENSMYNTYKVKWNEKYANLHARYEADAPNDAMLWSDITKFNCKLKNAQYWHENIWTSWLNEGACMEIEQIPPSKTKITYPDDFIGPRLYEFKEQ